jgi:integrase
MPSRLSDLFLDNKISAWVKVILDDWLARAGVETRPVFRPLNKSGRILESRLSEDTVWNIVREYGARIGKSHFAPHDLRRTCAKLCRVSGGDLEQIQLLLGHASVQTTERYLGTRQNLVQAVNDNLPVEPDLAREPGRHSSGPDDGLSEDRGHGGASRLTSFQEKS